jgi:hypothetical protein
MFQDASFQNPKVCGGSVDPTSKTLAAILLLLLIVGN